MSLVAPCNRPYRPYGAGEAVLYDRSPEILLCGPAGTGKSRASLEKFNILAEKYDGCRLLFVRKTRQSLSESALVTFESKVMPENHPALGGPSRPFRHSYKYPNGSEIVLAGMDNPGRIFSTEYDAAYVQEATELEEDDWETITSRLRNGVMPFQQIVADCNPDKPTHWLKVRCDQGRTKLLPSKHQDNPVFWDHGKGDWTPVGRSYVLETLAGLSGPRRARLYLGLWAGAEGTVYEDSWDAGRNIVDRFDIPASWPRYWVVDFGYTNPFVWQAWAEDPDGRLYRYREIYHTKRLVEDHCKRILELEKGEPEPKEVVCDHDAEDRATFEKHSGRRTVGAKKTVSDGIQAVASRLKPAGDGKARLFYLRDSLDEVDKALEGAKRPTKTEDEFDGYVWDERGGQKKGDQPMKENDHGMDASRYMVAAKDLTSKRYGTML